MRSPSSVVCRARPPGISATWRLVMSMIGVLCMRGDATIPARQAARTGRPLGRGAGCWYGASFMGGLWEETAMQRDFDLVVTILSELRDADTAALSEAHIRTEEHTSELQSRENLVCRILLEKK